MRNQLFNESARMGFAEQLIRGVGQFANLCNHTLIKTHSVNNNNAQLYKLKLKQILIGDNTNSFYVGDYFNTNILRSSSINSSIKITLRAF